MGLCICCLSLFQVKAALCLCGIFFLSDNKDSVPREASTDQERHRLFRGVINLISSWIR